MDTSKPTTPPSSQRFALSSIDRASLYRESLLQWVGDDTYHYARSSGDHTYLCWLHNRLITVYDEHPDTDFVLTLREFAMRLEVPKKQTRRASMVETVSSTLFGLVIATVANWWLLPLWGLHPSLSESTQIGLLFTLISIGRGYVWRRSFEWLRIQGWLP